MAVVAVVLATVACGSDSGESSSTAGDRAPLTLYNAQHEDLVTQMVSAFTKQSGIEVNLRNGSDLEMANQIVQEGDRSPADVFLTENSPAMALVDSRNGFAPIDESTLSQVPSRYAPASKRWVGFAARATVLAYNKDDVRASELPRSIMDLAQPRWKGKVGYSPTGADFQAIVSAVLALEGESATKAWLDGLAKNGVAFQGNTRVMKAVDDGRVPVGIIYHYYWYQDQAESGENSSHTALHFFGNQDPGAFTSVSGAGVLASSKHQPEAQELVRFLTGKAGQEVLANSTALEYTVGSDVPANKALKPLAELDAPAVDPGKLNSAQVITMMQDAGIL
ncbi:MAG TPA: iron ABC transporter substrate-binding protein [Solirubrobacteraceae bacterium]